MSLSKVLRGAEAEAVSLWELPSVDGNVVNQRGEPEEPPEPEMPEIQLPTEEEVEAIREEARQAGFAEGRDAGYAEGEREAQAASEKAAKKIEKEQRQRLKTLDRLIRAQARPLEQLDDEVQDQLLSLVLTLARQVIRRELQMQPGEILGVIRESVALLPLAERDVTVRVHPEDHRFLQELLGEESDERAWTLVDDPALSRGGCVVQAQRARVDASLETRLAQLASQLLGAREEDLRDDDGAANADEEPDADENTPAPDEERS
ncbi:flagellar assembly protein FliH [Aquisalimonas sp.]|uniref:flagellar assembly protein FliH n=1 Tax=unclassified Aquisalimonas TaxID=2644645 RepID=UPI0025B7C4B0|nr:flagellar assembly protein FliH [Aquisalimonas sp.]